MLRKNVAGQFVHIAAVNATTGAALTGATVSIRRCLDGTFAAGGATITEDTGLGFYKVALTQADTNGNDVAYFFTATNMIPVCLNVVTTAGDPTDSVRFGLTSLPNAAAGANTGLPVVGTQVPNATAGAANGLIISGSNSGTTTLGALTVTGSMTISDGLLVSRSSANTSAITATGNGTGSGAVFTSGAGATGDGVQATAGSTNGNGLALTKTGTGVALKGATSDLIAASVSGSVGSVTGAVGSVTGAVGSVTGNVGGNVVGSVASVVAAVSTTDFTTAIAESYRANGATGTPAQILYEILGNLVEANNSGTTRTVKGLDRIVTESLHDRLASLELREGFQTF